MHRHTRTHISPQQMACAWYWEPLKGKGASAEVFKVATCAIFDVGTSSALYVRVCGRVTLEEVVFCVLVWVVRAPHNIKGRPACHHLKH